MTRSNDHRTNQHALYLFGMVLAVAVAAAFTLSIVQNGSLSFGPSQDNVGGLATGGTLDAECMSSTFPTTMEAGTSYTGTITIKNTGSETWNNDDGLGAHDPTKEFFEIGSKARKAQLIFPGQNQEFTFTVTTPPGIPPAPVPFAFRMVSGKRVAWWGDFCPNTQVTIVEPGDYDVELVQEQPMYTWRQIPYAPKILRNPFLNVEWVPDGTSGYFVVAGDCNPAVGGRLSGDWGTYEAAGMYILNEDGSYVGKRDVCFDTASSPAACEEGGGCSVGEAMHPIGNGNFVRDIHRNGATGISRGPAHYDINSGVQMVDLLFYNDHNGPPFNPIQEGDIEQFSNVAVANGVMVGIQRTHVDVSGMPTPRGFSGLHDNRVATAYYSVPGFNKLAEFSTPFPGCPGATCSGKAPISLPTLHPIVGVGDYFLATEESVRSLADQPPIGVYRMPSASQLQSGQRPEKVQDLDIGWIANYAFDPLDENRIIIYSFKTEGGSHEPYTMRAYTVGPDGLVLESEYVKDIGVAKQNGQLSHAKRFAVAGEYLAYDTCGGQGHPRAGHMCALVVEKNGETLLTEPLPLDANGWIQHPIGLSISPTGTLLVTAGSRGGCGRTDGSCSTPADNGNLYLYQIKNFDGAVPPPSESSFHQDKILRFLDRLRAFLEQ